KAFVAALLLTNLASFVEARGQSRHLRHFTLIEEAHRLLPNVSTEKGDPESADPRRRMVEQFGEMLAELRAFGEGLAIVEQIPTKILPDAVKNTVTKVIHRVPAEDDRKVLAGAINATAEQAAVFTALKPGEAVLSVESHPVPVRVEVENVVSKLSVPVGEVSDEEVRRRMVAFYLRNPLPRQAPRTSDIRLREVVDSDAFRVKFEESYRTWRKLGDAWPLALVIGVTAQIFAKDETELVGWSYKILNLASAYYLPLNAEDRERFARLFVKTMDGSLKSVRGPR
ncbi:MAG: ATP-binding protein, partial [Nitrososphaerota archaeon]|nr:ATP-binding protein [Nitrososphaerota archaeon]